MKTIRLVLALLLAALPAAARQETTYTRTADVLYGRKFGTALTLDVFTPRKDANGAAIVAVVSGGWFSAHEAIDSPFVMQAETFLAKLKEAGVATELVVRKGAGHGWPDLAKDWSIVADWFDKHLAKKP